MSAVDLSKLGPLPADIQRALQQAAQQEAAVAQQGNVPIVTEISHKMANFGLALADDNPVIIFDTPQAPGIERRQYPFSWEAFDNYLRTLQKFREERGPKDE